MAILLVLLLTGGCFTIDTGNLDATGDENIIVSNYGYYLFNLIPLAGGNANETESFPWAVFRDDVTMDKIQRRFLEYAAYNNKKVKEIAYHNHQTILFNVPGTSFLLPIPYLLTYREIQLSGVLTK